MAFGIRNGAAALLVAAMVAGCAVHELNPVTGERIYAPASAETEAIYGREAKALLIADYGIYQDAALTAYVDRVGQALAKNAVRKGIHYTFAILDDDDMNAFALPGGFVYITRGALAFINSEAELAAILGHEIGHIDAFHFGRIAGEHNAAMILLSALLKRSSPTADDLEMARRMTEASERAAAYSKAQEFEADALGIHYMALAGYDPQASVSAMKTQDAKSRLEDALIHGNSVALEVRAMDQSHPATPDREVRAAAAAKNAAPPAGAGTGIGRDAYLAAVDGMTFGANPEQGTVEGHRLVNTALGFSFDAPDDFDLFPGHGGVLGVGSKAAMIIESVADSKDQSMAAFVQSSVSAKGRVEDVRPLGIEGYRGATGLVANDPFLIRVAALRDGDNHVVRLLYVAPKRTFKDLDTGFLDSLKSFRALKGAEAKPRPPLHLKIVTVAPGDTVQKLADRMALKDKRMEWFRVINGLEPTDEVHAGDRVKVVE